MYIISIIYIQYIHVILLLNDFHSLPNTERTETAQVPTIGTPTMTPQPLSMDIFAASMASVMEPILRFGPHEKAAFLANNDHIFIMGCNGI